jgi:condensin complex subunit 3
MVRDLYADVSEAVGDGLLADATSRNALYKIHVSLGKIVNVLDEQHPPNRRTSRSVSAALDRGATEERAVSEESKIKEEEFDESDEATVVLKKEEIDSVSGDISSDDDDTKMESL